MSKPPVNLKLHRAKRLIQSKRYAEARRVLTGVDHPIAHKWLVQLYRLEPARVIVPRQLPSKTFNARKWLFVAVTVLLLALMCYALIVAPVINDMNSTIDEICAEYDCD